MVQLNSPQRHKEHGDFDVKQQRNTLWTQCLCGENSTKIFLHNQ